MKQKIRDWLTQQFGNDEALFAELYSQYEGDMKSGIETLQTAIKDGDIAAMTQKAHALKGISLMIGDEDVSALCLTLERVCKANDKPMIADALNLLVDAVTDLLGGGVYQVTLMDGMEVKMEYNVEEKGGVLVVALIGRLVAACTEEVMEAITPRMARTRTKMVLDLSRMSHIDSSGLGMLVKLLHRATDKGGVVKIACLQSHPRIVFDITKAYRVFEIYDSVDAALKSL